MKNQDFLSNPLLPNSGPAKGVDPFSWAAAALTTALVNAAPGAVVSFGVGGIAAFSQAVVAGAALGGLALASGAFSGGARGQVARPADTKRSYDLEDGPRIVVLGRARVGGTYALRNSVDYDTYRLLLQCQGPIDGVEEYFVKDRIVVVDADGTVTSPPYQWADGASYLKFFTKDGSIDQTAFQQLLDAFPDNWTDDHRARGIMATLAKYTSPGVSNDRYLKTWNGQYPDWDTLVRAPGLYDPRQSGQYQDAPDSWAWSDNGVLNVLRLLTASLDDGGQGMPFGRFDLDDIAFEADKADTPVSSLSGSEVWSKCSGSYTTDTARGAVLADVLRSTGAQIVTLQNGKKSIRLVEDNPTPTTTIRKEIIENGAWGGSELVNDANSLSLFYLSPERFYQMAELQIHDKDWSKDQTSIDRTGKREHKMELQFCPQSGQAQRIGRRVFSRMRSMKGEIVTKPAGFFAMGHVAATVEMDALEEGYTAQVELGSPTLNFADQRMTFPVTYIPELAPWDAATHEAAAPVGIPDVQWYGDLDKPVVALADVKIVKIDGGDEIRYSWTAVDGASGYEATFLSYDGSVFGARQSMTEDITNRWAYGGPVTVGTQYRVEVRASNADQEIGAFSDKIDKVLAYDTAAPTGCTLRTEYGEPGYLGAEGESRQAKLFTVYATCTDLNVSKAENVFIRPFEEAAVFTVLVEQTGSGHTGNPYTWPADPTGTITFENSTGQTTVVSY